MPIEYFNNSPVPFRSDSNDVYGQLVCDGEVAPKFCQPVKTTDTTPWQVKPCDYGSDFILNGTFTTQYDWTLGTGWTINTTSNRAEGLSGGGTGDLTQTVNELEGITNATPKTFEVRFNVASFDDNASGNDLVVTIGGAAVETINDLTTGGPNQTYLICRTVSTPVTDLTLRFSREASVDCNISAISVKVAECTLTQELLNPEFISGVTGWTISAGWAYGSQEIAILKSTSGILSQAITSPLQSFIRLEYEIVAIDNTSVGDCDVNVGGTTLTTLDATTTAGVKYHYFYLTSDSNGLIEFDATSLGITLEYCTIYELGSPGYIVQDCDGDFIEDVLVGATSNATSQMQFSHSWTGYANGCYQFLSFDQSVLGSELVANGSITSPATEWTFGTNWSLVTNTASFTGAYSGLPLFSQVIAILADKYYLVSYDIDTWTDGSGGADGSMDVSLGNVTMATYTDNSGVGTNSHVVSTKGLVSFSVTFAILTGTTNLNVVIDNISVTELTVDRCSECFQVGTWLDSAGCETTRLLEATNVDNAFGFDYTNFTLTLSMRVLARLKRANFEQLEYEAFLFNNNSVTTNYAQSRKLKAMLFELHPDYVYNAVQIMSDHDTFDIDGVEHNKSTEGIQPDWQPRFLAATAEAVYYESSQPNRINDNC